MRTELQDTGTLYTLDEALLRDLAPDVILTQRLCDVCAVGYDSVVAFAASMTPAPRVVNLEPMRLGDVFQDVLNVGSALGALPEAAEVVTELQARVNAVKRRAAVLARRRCVLLEWIDPPFRTGHWGPDLVALAGGADVLGVAGTKAEAVPWEAVRDARPEVLVVACCGYDIARTMADLPILQGPGGWSTTSRRRAGCGVDRKRVGVFQPAGAAVGRQRGVARAVSAPGGVRGPGGGAGGARGRRGSARGQPRSQLCPHTRRTPRSIT